MKVLCFSDLHCDAVAAARLATAAIDVDLVIGAGDFANQHRGIEKTIDVLSSITKPTVLVPGNGETFEELEAACADWNAATVLHGNGTQVEGQAIWGVGGGIPVTPFGAWSYDFTEEQAIRLLEGCPPRAILVVHSPPIETVDHDSSGRVRGSTAIRQTVIDKQPKLTVCGHIHSDWGKQVELGTSLILNAGPTGIVVEID